MVSLDHQNGLNSIHSNVMYYLLLTFIMTLWSSEFSLDDFQYDGVVLPCDNVVEFISFFFICYIFSFMLYYTEGYLVNEWCPISCVFEAFHRLLKQMLHKCKCSHFSAFQSVRKGSCVGYLLHSILY